MVDQKIHHPNEEQYKFGAQTLKQFLNEKRQSLSRVDRSQKGSIDEPIEQLVDLINSSDDFYTTSSCSGRVIVVSDPIDDQEPVKKKNIKWQFVSHSLVDDQMSSDELIQPLMELEKQNLLPNSSTLKFESFILHVRCRSMESARRLLHCAMDSGQRNSGLMLSKRGHLTVAIRNTLNMEVPLIYQNQMLVHQNYLQTLIRICNEKFQENFKMIQRFHQNCLDQNIFSDKQE